MYHCNIHFNLIGNACVEFRTIRQIAPLHKFIHKFVEDETAVKEHILSSNVIIVNLVNRDLKTDDIVNVIFSNKREATQVVALVRQDQIPAINGNIWKLQELWIAPMSEQEVEYRFTRWQEQFKVSKEFWQSKQYLEAVIESTPNMVWFKNKNGIHEKVNNAFCDIVNKSKEQVEGQRHAYIWNVEEDDPNCIASEEEVMRLHKTVYSNEIVKTGDENREFDVYKSPLYDTDGTVMGTVGVGIDVTKEKLYRKDLIAKSETLEKIFTTLDCGIIRHSMDGRQIISINEAALSILGYKTKEEMLNDGFDLIAMSVVEEDKIKLYTAISGLWREGDSVSVDYRVRHKDGRIVYVMGNVKLIKENNEYLYQRFLWDCTFQKMQENKEKRQYSDMIQALSVGYDLVCYFGTRIGLGKVIQMNEAHKDRFGDIFVGDILLEGVMKHYIDRFVCEEDKERMRKFFCFKNIKDTLDHKGSYYITYKIQIDDETFYYQIKMVAIKGLDDAYNIVLGFRCVDEEVRNDMEQKRALEEMLKQVNSANEAKTNFLSNMSHDIRTPMNAILGFTTLALNHPDSAEKMVEYLNKIKSSGTYMLNLLNNVLDMSYIESGRMKIEEKPLNLLGFIDKLKSSVQEDVKTKDLTLNVNLSNLEHEKVYSDELRLYQVLINLLSNAIKYTPKGGKIDLVLSEDWLDSEEYGNYEIRVKDNGIGMSDDFMDKIFEPFERERNTTHSGVAGTGLGLSITKNIVDNMNGVIEVHSKEGVGTEFIVSFIFRICTEEIEMSETGKEAKTALGSGECKEEAEKIEVVEEPLNVSNCRLLLVEDNELNQEIAVEILEGEGYEVEVASDGKEAVEKVSSSEPGYYQAVLMDIQMPVMNGYEATKEIRGFENKELANIPILAMTANAFEADKQMAMRAGMNDFISKPIDIEHLFGVLNRVLK